MKPDEIKHLLGGYATGTLTAGEQKALFDAALHDQNLFEALAREQALKETLEAADVRRELLGVLESATSWREQARAWMRWQIPLAATGVLAAVALTVIAITWYGQPPGHPEIAAKTQVAVAKAPAVQSAHEGPAQVLDRNPGREKLLLRQTLPPTPEPSRVPKALPSSANTKEFAATEAKQSQPAQLAAEQGISPGRSGEARDLFYGTPNPATGLSSGFVGGVAGGYPSSAMARARPKVETADSVSSERAEPAREAFGIRYSGRDLQGSPPQLLVESNTDAVLYIFRRAESGDWLPVTSGGMSLKARTPATTPSIGVHANAPSPRTLLVLSKSPLPELAQTGAELTAALDRLRTLNDMADVRTQSGSGSNYVVMPRHQPGATLVVPVNVP